MGRNGNNGHNTCIECQSRLTPIKLYAPEILRVFSGGNKEYTRLGILSNYSVCLSSTCQTGRQNLESYDRVIADGMIRQE